MRVTPSLSGAEGISRHSPTVDKAYEPAGRCAIFEREIPERNHVGSVGIGGGRIAVGDGATEELFAFRTRKETLDVRDASEDAKLLWIHQGARKVFGRVEHDIAPICLFLISPFDPPANRVMALMPAGHNRPKGDKWLNLAQGEYESSGGPGPARGCRMRLRADQIRAARGLLGWSQADLAERTRLSVRTIKRVEGGDEINAAADLSIRRTFEDDGVAFVFSAEDVLPKALVAGVLLVAK